MDCGHLPFPCKTRTGITGFYRFLRVCVGFGISGLPSDFAGEPR